MAYLFDDIKPINHKLQKLLKKKNKEILTFNISINI